MTYTFSDNLISDFHKDAFGVRPDADYIYWWNGLRLDDKQAEWDSLEKTITHQMDLEEKAANRAVEAFKMNLAHIIAVGGDDWDVALGWLVVEEKMKHQQDVEAWVYDQGFLFTDFGKQIVEEVCAAKNIYYHQMS